MRNRQLLYESRCCSVFWNSGLVEMSGARAPGCCYRKRFRLGENNRGNCFALVLRV